MATGSVATRRALTSQRVLSAALDLADHEGLDALTMRRLAEALGVEAMSLYHHVPNKNAILDGVVELAFREIEVEAGGFGASRGLASPDVAASGATSPHAASPDEASPDEASRELAPSWRDQLRARILAARRVLLRHPWLPALLESRSTLGPSMARYTDDVVRIMHAGGLDYDLVHHATHTLGSRMYGFSQELRMDGDGGADAQANLNELLALTPHIAAMLAEVAHDDDATLGWCDDQTEFEFGLDLVLDGLERLRATRAREATPRRSAAPVDPARASSAPDRPTGPSPAADRRTGPSPAADRRTGPSPAADGPASTSPTPEPEEAR